MKKMMILALLASSLLVPTAASAAKPDEEQQRCLGSAAFSKFNWHHWSCGPGFYWLNPNWF